MSGFELDKQRLADKLPIGKEAGGSNRAEANRALLDQLRQSSDIARDLASLYSERPYVYARVLKQLGTVLGKGRVKKLHTDVVAKAQALHQRAMNSKNALKKALKDEPKGGQQGSGEPGGGTGETSSKKIQLNVPLLKLDKEIELKSEGGNHSISCDDWNIPFLNTTTATVKMVGEDVSEIEVNATLTAKHLKNTSTTFTLKKNGTKFDPYIDISTEVDIPGLKGLAVQLSASPKDSEVGADVSGSATVFEDKLDTEAEGSVTVSDVTDFALSFTVKSAAKGEAGGGDAGGDAGGAGGKEGAAKPALAFEGTISVNSEGNVLSGSGTMSVSGLAFLASPDSSISLEVTYEEATGFAASLLEPVTFAEYTVVGGAGAEGGAQQGGQQQGGGEQEGGLQLPTTVVLTVNEASYSADDELSVGMAATAKIGGFMTADASVSIVKNQLESGQFKVNVPKFGLPAELPILSGNLTGTVDYDSAGFTHAGVEGPLSITIGGKTWPITLQSLDVDKAGLVTGTINLPETWKIGCVSFDTLSASFNTSGLQSVAGSMSIDHSLIKSEKSGITITGNGTSLTAKGLVSVLGSEESEFGKVDFSTTMAPDLLEGTGTLTLSNDYKVGKSKLVICQGASATLSFKNETFDPIKFQGDYKYNMPEGEGGGEGDKASGSKELKLYGAFTDCTMDMETGALSGSASAKLGSPLRLEQTKANYIEIVDSHRKAETDITFAFENSELTTISGTLAAKAGMSLGPNNDHLDLEGKLANFKYDVAGSLLSGTAHLGLNTDLEVPMMANFKLRGNDRTNFEADIAANQITEVRFNCDAQLTIVGAFIKGGSADIDMNCEKGTVNMESSAVSIEKLEMSPENSKKSDLTLLAHNGETELTIADGSSITSSVVDNQLQSVHCAIQFDGNSTALNNEKDPIAFKGNVEFDIPDITNAGDAFSGSLDITTTADYTLDEIPDVDKIILRAGTSVGVSLDQESIQTITGTILLRYTKTEGNQFFKNGYSVDLDGTDLVYDVPAGLFSGNASLKPAADIDISLGKTDEKGNSAHGLKILAKGTSLNVVVASNKLTKLNGTAGFSGSFGIGDGGKINIDEGNAALDVNVDTGAVNSFSVESTVSCDFKVGKVQVTTKDAPVTASCDMDDQGLKTATLNGNVHLIVPVGDKHNIDLTAGSDDGMTYDRETGISGMISVKCESETVLGEFTHNKGETSSLFEYGLGNGEEAAAAFNAVFEANTLTAINGSAGFFLRQTPDSEDALKVSGNIDFDATVSEDDVTLNSAVGEVKIAKKNLFTVGTETLVLEESTATVTVTNDKLESLSGTVNLSLADAEGSYLGFMSSGEFDCLNTKSFSGDVSASVTREKQLGKNIPVDGRGDFGIYLAPGDSSFDTHIEDNKIQEASGSIGIATKLNGEPFFTGVVSGSYKAANPETNQETQVDGSGSIRLDRDLEFPAGEEAKFALGAGSEGTATIVNNEIESFSGSIIIKVAAPGKTLKSGNVITVTAAGEVDVKNALIKSFTGKASLSGAVEITPGLSITSLNADVSIIDNEIQEIGGAASIKFEKGGFTVVGACERFRWIKGGAEPDKFDFAGSLTVTAFKDKLKGTARVTYNTMSNPNAAPEIEGELEFKITEWLRGMVGVKFGEAGWDDPIIWGSIEVVNAELIPGRRLMSFSKDLGISIPVYAGINVEAGIGMGASIDMEPVLINGKIDIGEYHIKEPQGLPDFEMGVEASTGLSLKASIAPYIGVNIGIANVLNAGLRVRGKAEMVAQATASVGGKLMGGKDGFGGELSLGFGVSASANVSVIPEVYASLFGNELKYEIAKWSYDLGEIFSFDWNKTFKFGDTGSSTEDGGADVSTITPSTNQVETEAVKGEAEAEHAPEGATGGEKDKPALPGSDEVGQDSMGEKTGDSADGVGGIGETIEQVTQVAEAIGAIGQGVGIISELVMGFATGYFVGLAIAVFKLIFIDKKLTISNLSKMFKDIVEGVQALQALLTSAGDLLSKLLPDWLIKLIEFFKGETVESLSNKVITILEQKIAEMPNPIPRVLQPVIGFLKGQTQKLVEILDLLSSGNVASIIKGVIKILGFALSSLWDLIKMGGQMLQIMKIIIQECVASGDIWLKERDNGFWRPNDYKYGVKIYDLINIKGDNWALGKALKAFLPSFGLKVQKM